MNKGRYYIMTYYQILSCLKLWCVFFLTNTHLEEIMYHACVHVKTHQVFFFNRANNLFANVFLPNYYV